MGHRQDRIRRELGSFMRAYGRVAASNCSDPNDRNYSHKFEAEIKRMKPEDLDRLLRDEDDGDEDD
ncbi:MULTISPECIES: hypothetical protein [Micromonospora]|uniref:DUF3073 domain-containing protein n=1 Tax=Micromonospora antibiotica TaxID=2807623 RepID=A0ABS3VH82_9ACTN|nr:hypothetical protein [Micromonospora antibiotica]MBO4164971.1 hypothetical protein [Micromonospora antibiotica]